MEGLATQGYAVIRGPEIPPHLVNEFLRGQVEYTSPPPRGYTLGGFGAFGNPSSFHHPHIRTIKGLVVSHLWGDFQSTFPGRKLQVLFDRFAFRKQGTSPTAESWHRDESSVSLPGDRILGGWINLSTITQEFSCIPNTHGVEPGRGQFNTFSKEQGRELRPNRRVVQIPPGHILLFWQHLIHEVSAKKAKQDNARLFMGWRITDHDQDPFNYMEVIRTQGIPMIPSGQLPPIYAKLHWACWRPRITELTQCVRPEMIDPRTGEVYRFMPSLESSGLPKFPEYTADEIALHSVRVL